MFYPLIDITHADPIILSGEYNVVSARISSNERYVVFLTYGPSRLVSYDRQTNESTILAFFPGEPEFSNFSITGDDQFVVFPASVNGPSAEINRVPIDGSAPPTRTVSIDTDPGGLNYFITPDGQTLVYLDGTGNNIDIKAVPVIGGERIFLNEGLENGVIYNFALSPNGDYVTYILEDPDRYTITQRILVPLAGGSPTVINPEGSYTSAFEVAFAESVDALFFTAYTEEEGTRLYRVPLDGAPGTVITPPNRSVYDDFQLSADEQYLLYREFDQGTQTLQRLTVSDNTITPVTTLTGQGTIFFNVAEEAPLAFIQTSAFVSPIYTATHSSAVFAPPSSAIVLATLTGEEFGNSFAETQSTHDGATLVIRQGAFNQEGSLYSVDGDGSAEPVTLFAEPDVRDFFIAENQQEIFFQTRNASGAAYHKVPIGGGTVTPLLQSAGKDTFINTVGLLSNSDLLLIDSNGEADPRLDSLYLLEGVVTTEPATVETYLPLIRYELATPRE